jgi:radical SAM protein with 4Fe4S-binding SPASM domain
MAKLRYWKVNIEILNLCNLQCSFCPEVLRKKQWMAPDFFRSVLDEVAPLTRVVTLHLMGEPLLHPNFEEIVGICVEKKLQIFLVSNGVLLGPKQERVLLGEGFRQVSFSLHSFKDNFGDKDPSEYLERIFQFTERALEQRPRLFINYRLWNSTAEMSLEQASGDLLSRIESRFKVLLPRDWARGAEKRFPIKGGLSLHLDEKFSWPTLEIPELNRLGTCQALSSHFGILADGTVVPCCLDKEGQIPLGKIGEVPLREILQSPKAKALLDGFKRGALIDPLCRRCQYVERFSRAPAPSLVSSG